MAGLPWCVRRGGSARGPAGYPAPGEPIQLSFAPVHLPRAHTGPDTGDEDRAKGEVPLTEGGPRAA
ncbi:hypothetical protein GCM10010243_08980 [Streptomyces matensis]|nr:hypothetical protein GCM10010243_08980 [Streptomyces matensis]